MLPFNVQAPVGTVETQHEQTYCGRERGLTVAICLQPGFMLLARHGQGFGLCLRKQSLDHRDPSGIHRILARWTAVTHCFIDPGCCMGRKIRQNRGDLYMALTYMKDFTGRLTAIEVRERRPLPRRAVRIPRYWGCMPHLEGRAERYTKLALCLEPVHGASRIRFPDKPICAVPSKNRSASSPYSRPCRSTRKAGFSSGQAQKRTFTGGEVWTGGGRREGKGGVGDAGFVLLVAYLQNLNCCCLS